MKLISISCAWVLGIFLGSILDFPLLSIFIGLLPLPFLLLFKARKTLIILAAICLLSFFGAAIYYPSSLPDHSPLTVFNNQGVVELRGNVIAEPEVKSNVTHLQISVKEFKISSEWQNTRGKVLLYVPRYPEYSYGDLIWIRGVLRDPPQFEEFDYQVYLARQRIYSTLSFPQIELLETNTGFGPAEWIYSVRKRLSQSLTQALPEPQASLAQGIVLGIRSTIPDSLKNNLSITGTAHLLAISGVNLSIIAGILLSMGLWVFGRRHYFYVWITLAAVWFYALLTGMEAPVIRSAIMATMFLFAELLGRQKSAFVALAFSAAIMVGLDPQVLWSISFQLSFLAMTGLIFIAPRLQNLAHKMTGAKIEEADPRTRVVNTLIDSVSITIAATIAVWPLIAYYFGIVSFVGPLATFLITPVFPAIIFCGTATSLIGLVISPVALVISWVAWIFISYMLWLVNAFAALPVASIKMGTVDVSLVWIYYTVLVILIFIMANFKKIANLMPTFVDRTKSGLQRTSEIFSALPRGYLITPLLILALLTSLAAASLPDSNLHISFLDVGEGEAIFIQNAGQNILIDGGPNPQAVCLGLGNRLPFWDRKLDLVILTHPHLDHLSGLIEILKRYKVEQILASDLTSDSPFYQEWLSLIDQKNIPVTLAWAGQSIILANGVIMNVLNPPENSTLEGDDVDNNGLVLQLAKGQVSFLLTADIGQETEQRMVKHRDILPSTVLKVAHHGSSTSTAEDFLYQVKPQVAVISVGAANTFGHPDEQVLERLGENLGSYNSIYRTDLNGTIEFITDGTILKVKTDH